MGQRPTGRGKSPMKRIAIRTVWTLQDPDRPPLPARLIELLVQVHAQGSLLAACQQQIGRAHV